MFACIRDSDYGVAILSALPFVDTRVLTFAAPTPARSADVIYMDREQQPRGAAAVLVRARNLSLLWVVTTHLSHLSSSEEQRGQARELIEWCDMLRLEQNCCPLLLCGDMNSAPGSPSQRGPGAWHIITGHPTIADKPGGWLDCWEVVHGADPDNGYTCPSLRPRSRIDQFFLPTDVLVSVPEQKGKADVRRGSSMEVVDIQ